MKLKHWAQIALKDLCTRITLEKNGTVTARRLADYPIGGDYRRCVIEVIPNDDAKFGYQKPVFTNDVGTKNRLDREVVIKWLLDNGNRFTEYKITPDDVTEWRDFENSDPSKPREKWSAVYEFTYKYGVQKGGART